MPRFSVEGAYQRFPVGVLISPSQWNHFRVFETVDLLDGEWGVDTGFNRYATQEWSRNEEGLHVGFLS